MGILLNPILTATAGTSKSYNPGIAETFSWIPVEGEALGRPLYARASYITNFSDVNPVTATAGGYTLCETRSSGNPTFISKQILLHNNSNNDANVQLTLTSGMSCLVPIGKNTSANHIMTLNLAVSGVNNYAGTTITFFA